MNKKSADPDTKELLESWRKANQRWAGQIRKMGHLPNATRLPSELEEALQWNTGKSARGSTNDLFAALLQVILDGRGPEAAAIFLLDSRHDVTKQAFAFLAGKVLARCLDGAPKELAQVVLGTAPRDRRHHSEKIAKARDHIREHPKASDREAARTSGLSAPTIATLRRKGVLPERQV